MADNIVVKTKTEMSLHCQKTDILALYGVPDMLDKMAKKEKTDLFGMLNPCFVLADSLNEISNAGGFVVNIPKGFEDAFKSGLAHLDKSSKNIGEFTPNIRINGETGIKGQLTISKGIDCNAITHSLSNMAMMAMLQGVLSKLDDIKEINEDILKGQENDRIGKILGSFKEFINQHTSDGTSSDILKMQGCMCRQSMQEGLAQLLLQIDEEKKKLDKMPRNHRQVVWRTLMSGWKPVVRPEIYEKFAYDLQLYSRLLLLSDVVLLCNGQGDAIRENHKVFNDYCSLSLNSDFSKHMKFLLDRNPTELDVIDRFNEYCSNQLSATSQNAIILECTPDDVKLLSRNVLQTM